MFNYGEKIIEILDSYQFGELDAMGLNLALIEFWKAVARGEFSNKNIELQKFGWFPKDWAVFPYNKEIQL